MTLRWIARKAGVSLATVSRALRRPETVAAPTRDHILALVERHRYVPDTRAAAFSARRTGLVGLVVPTLSNSIYAAFTEAIQAELDPSGCKLLIANSGYLAAAEHGMVRALVERRVDGVVLTGFARDPALYALLRQYRIPFVVTWAVSPDPTVPSIAFDNAAAAASATDHLIDLGHRRIGIVCGVVADNDRAAQRLAAFRARLAARGLPLDPELVAEGPFETAFGAAAATRMMGLPAPPTALFCANDIQALGALFACRRLGLRVPEDVSIVGFDDLPITRDVDPPLSTVHVPATAMGRAAAAALLASADGGEPIASRLLPATLVRRASTAPPPAPAGR